MLQNALHTPNEQRNKKGGEMMKLWYQGNDKIIIISLMKIFGIDNKSNFSA